MDMENIPVPLDPTPQVILQIKKIDGTWISLHLVVVGQPFDRLADDPRRLLPEKVVLEYRDHELFQGSQVGYQHHQPIFGKQAVNQPEGSRLNIGAPEIRVLQ